jgi:hypothetical protein
MRALRYVALVAVFAAVVAAGWGVYQRETAPPRWSQTYRAEYATLPPDDAALEAWLKGQPGVSDVRVERQGSTIAVSLDLPAQHPALSITAQCERLGYTGRRDFYARYGARQKGTG